MPITGIPQDRLTRIVEPMKSLRPGQIVQGKILKIYPNHRAQLQIGSQKMVAQLEAPLAVGERYHFQVGNTKDVIQLKVIGTNLKNESAENVAQLLNELNIKESRATTQFVQTLLNEKIPFTKQQLQQAIQLLQRANSSPEAQRILIEMIGRQLPMTESVFNALLVKGMTTVSKEFTQLLNVLQQSQLSNDTQSALLAQLSQLLNENDQNANRLIQMLSQSLPNINIEQLLNEVVQQRESLFHNMQNLLNNLPDHSSQFTQYNVERAKVLINQMPISQDIKQSLITLLENDRSSFLNVIRSFANHLTFDEIQSFLNNGSIKQQFLSHINQFTQVSGLAYENIAQQHVLNQSHQPIEQMLSQLVGQQQNIQQQTSHFINKWTHMFENNMSNSMEQEQLNAFRQDVEQLTRLLPQEQRQLVLNLLQTSDSTNKIWQFVQTLNRTDTFEQINTFLMNVKDNKINLQTMLLNQMGDMRSLLHSLHIPIESSQTGESMEQLQQTIKGMLLQLVQQNESAVGEKAQQALHFINGLQLNSVNETSHFMQASIQVPGERIGLNGDLFMEFESKKTEDGKIDPDYCRILFFLNLSALKDTVIDMHVQKRFVTLTIYNDNDHIKQLAHPLYAPLNNGLEKLDYHLSTIKFKKLIEQQGEKTSLHVDVYENDQENRGGVDFRI